MKTIFKSRIKSKAERNNNIWFDFNHGIGIKELALKYQLTTNSIREIIKKARHILKNGIQNKEKVIFKGRIYKSPETLAQKLGIKKESVIRAIKRQTKYQNRYQIKKAI